MKVEEDNTKVGIESVVVEIEDTEDSYHKNFSNPVTKMGSRVKVAKFPKA